MLCNKLNWFAPVWLSSLDVCLRLLLCFPPKPDHRNIQPRLAEAHHRHRHVVRDVRADEHAARRTRVLRPRPRDVGRDSVGPAEGQHDE